jgi:hypothetical protein
VEVEVEVEVDWELGADNANAAKKTATDKQPTTATAKKQKFTPPTPADVSAYCRERGGVVDPDRFINYYEANGWRVGRNPMRDWQAAVRTWEKSQFSTGNGGGRGQPGPDPESLRKFDEFMGNGSGRTFDAG